MCSIRFPCKIIIFTVINLSGTSYVRDGGGDLRRRCSGASRYKSKPTRRPSVRRYYTDVAAAATAAAADLRASVERPAVYSLAARTLLIIVLLRFRVYHRRRRRDTMSSGNRFAYTYENPVLLFFNTFPLGRYTFNPSTKPLPPLLPITKNTTTYGRK